MLPLMGSILTMRSANWATVLIAACIIVPQLVVAALSPWVGRRADKWGRRPILLIGFGALPLRCLLFAYAPDPSFVVFEQVLDGISAAALGVHGAAGRRRYFARHGRFNLAQGVIGTAVGIGAALSTSLSRICERSFRQPGRFSRSGCHCRLRFCLCLVRDARDAAASMKDQDLATANGRGVAALISSL